MTITYLSPGTTDIRQIVFATNQALERLQSDVGYIDKNNIWTGTNQFNAPVYFEDNPWADVKAYGAKGNNSHDDTAAIQAAIDHMSSTYQGGYVFFPPGNYKITGTVTVKTGVILLGSGINATAINGQGQDATAVAFDSSCANAGAYDIGIYGYNNAGATTDAVTIAAGKLVNLRTCQIWLGRYGLNTAGADGRYYNCYILGFAENVRSSGANFYTDCKIDGTATYAFHQVQGYAAGSMENQFMACDFSGTYTESIHIDDNATASAYNKFINCVVSSPIHVVSHAWTCFQGCEFGSTSWTLTGTGPITIVASNSLSGASTGTTGANVIKAGNFQIT